MVAASILPDADIALRAVGPEAYVFGRFGLSHSFLGGAALATFLSYAARPFLPGWGFLRVLALSAAAIAVHLAMDCLG